MNIIDEILNIPETLNIKNISMYFLLSEIGYFKFYGQVSPEKIFSKLKHQPFLFSKWVEYSENKRTDSGYFIKKEENNYIFGKRNSDGEVYFEKIDDKFMACSLFIWNELEEIQKNSELGGHPLNYHD